MQPKKEKRETIRFTIISSNDALHPMESSNNNMSIFQP